MFICISIFSVIQLITDYFSKFIAMPLNNSVSECVNRENTVTTSGSIFGDRLLWFMYTSDFDS